MLGFTPFKRHANKFNYLPRYYDPEREAREERRAELSGRRAGDAAAEYRPGQYIRTRSEARARRLQQERSRSGSGRVLTFAALAALLLLFAAFGYPRIMRALSGLQRPAVQQQTEEFDPYRPITVVPNDYVEE
ncbi:MAG: hypothetical protein K2O63_00245 [Alistipes sp.]|nr:hypothetical protein [Alistipes sp.]